METTLEFLTAGKPGREVHRHWPDEVKAKIVSESFCRGIIRDEQTAKVCCRPIADIEVPGAAEKLHLGLPGTPCLETDDLVVLVRCSSMLVVA